MFLLIFLWVVLVEDGVVGFLRRVARGDGEVRLSSLVDFPEGVGAERRAELVGRVVDWVLYCEAMGYVTVREVRNELGVVEDLAVRITDFGRFFVKRYGSR